MGRNMRRRMFGLAAGALLLAAFATESIVTMASAQTLGPMTSKAIGSWSLTEVTVDGKAPYGPNPQGSLLLTADGHYSLIVLGSGAAAPVAVFGTYKINESDGAVTLHIDGGAEIGGGEEMRRKITFSGDAMIADAMAPGEGTVRMSFKRSN
jgi:hypothetical protein